MINSIAFVLSAVDEVTVARLSAQSPDFLTVPASAASSEPKVQVTPQYLRRVRRLSVVRFVQMFLPGQSTAPV